MILELLCGLFINIFQNKKIYSIKHIEIERDYISTIALYTYATTSFNKSGIKLIRLIIVWNVSKLFFLELGPPGGRITGSNPAHLCRRQAEGQAGIRVVCPKFGHPALSSDIFLKYLFFSWETKFLNEINFFWNCFSFRMLIFFLV